MAAQMMSVVGLRATDRVLKFTLESMYNTSTRSQQDQADIVWNDEIPSQKLFWLICFYVLL
jgi:hypothetical protein